MSYEIKIGDTFSLPINIKDATTGEPYIFLPGTIFLSQIRNKFDELISTPTVDASKMSEGIIVLKVHHNETANWKVGPAKLDIKVQYNDNTKHSADFEFNIVKSITTLTFNGAGSA